MTYDLNGHVEIRIDAETFNIATNNIIVPLHVEILNNTLHKGTVYCQKALMTVNYKCISLLILNMSIQDDSKCGRLRDIVVKLVHAANERLKSIATQLLLVTQHEEMGELVTILRKLATRDESQVFAQMNRMSESLEEIAHREDMTEDNEKLLMEIVKQTHGNADRFYQNMKQFERKFLDLVMYEQKIMSLLDKDEDID